MVLSLPSYYVITISSWNIEPVGGTAFDFSNCSFSDLHSSLIIVEMISVETIVLDVVEMILTLEMIVVVEMIEADVSRYDRRIDDTSSDDRSS